MLLSLQLASVAQGVSARLHAPENRRTKPYPPTVSDLRKESILECPALLNATAADTERAARRAPST